MQLLYALPYLVAAVSASAVHELTADTIDSFTTKHSLSLISFDAPWCVHSRELKPEYESAAQKIQNEGWPFGHVDCAAEKELCEEYDIAIYPTILLFRGKERSIYNGDRKANKIVSFLRRHTYPAVTIMTSLQEVDEFKSEDKVTIIGYFDFDNKQINTTFSAVADSLRGEYLFGAISDDSFGRAESVSKPAIVLFKSFDEGKSLHTKHFDAETIKDFINEAASPLISELGVDLKPLHTFQVQIPVAFIFAQGEEERAQLVEALRPVAKATRSQVGWVAGDPTEHASIAAQLALGPGPWPGFAIRDNAAKASFAFPNRGSFQDLNDSAVRIFVQEFLEGKLQPSVSNDPVAALDDGLRSLMSSTSHDEL